MDSQLTANHEQACFSSPDREKDSTQEISPPSTGHSSREPDHDFTSNRPSNTQQNHALLDPRAPEFQAQLQSPPQQQSRLSYDSIPDTSPTYPYAHRIDARALLTDDATGEDIELDLPVYICVAQQNPAYGSRSSSRSWYQRGRSARIMENWRGGGRPQVRDMVAEDTPDEHRYGNDECGERTGRSGPWRRGTGLSRGLLRSRGEEGRGGWREERDEGGLVETGPGSDWVQIDQRVDDDATKATDGNVSIN